MPLTLLHISKSMAVSVLSTVAVHLY